MKFEEPKYPFDIYVGDEQLTVEPTVAGLTGEQWSQLRLWEDERRCDFEDELERRCPDEKVPGSNFCTFHERVEEYYDEYDCWVDRSFE